jgi:hypothetical protein
VTDAEIGEIREIVGMRGMKSGIWFRELGMPEVDPEIWTKF